jgi:hypothetical protein
VVVDRVGHKAVVRAAPIPGADLSVYRTLEQRVAASESGWTVTLVPPVLALPPVPLRDGAADESALQTVIWAGRRLQMPIGVTGDSPETTSAVVAKLTAAGLSAREVPGTSRRSMISLRWLTPQEAGAEPA